MTSTPSDPWAVPDQPPGPVPPGEAVPNPFPPNPGPHTPVPPGQMPTSGPTLNPFPQTRFPPEPYAPTSGPGSGLVAGGGPVIVQVGEIGVTSSVVHTPAGDIPLAGSTWQVSDYWHHEQRIPQWAIVCAIVGFCVLTVFSLLFLLVKETISRGTVQVVVTNGLQQYVARIPVTDQNQVAYIHQQVNYVRSLAAL